MWKNLSFTLGINNLVKKSEESLRDYNSGILYFIFLIFLKSLFYFLFNKRDFLFIKGGIYSFLLINLYFIFFYASLILFFLFFTKILINRRTEKILSFLFITFSFILISPFIDFFLSFNRNILEISPGMIFELIFLASFGFIYARVLSRKPFKWFTLPFLYFISFIFLILFPYYISKGNPNFWQGGALPDPFQKLCIIYSLIFIFAFLFFFLFFKEYKRGILKEFINYDFLFLNTFLPFMGFWIGYKFIMEKKPIFFDFDFNRIMPFIILLPPLIFSLASFLYKRKREYFYFPFLFSLIISLIISPFHFFVMLLIWVVYFFSHIVIKTRKIRPLEISLIMILLFIFGYSVLGGNSFLNLMDKNLIFFLFLFFFFYGLSRYFLMKRKKIYGFIVFLASLLFLPLFGFINVFYYSLLILIIIFISFFYFFGVFSLKAMVLTTYFFLTLFFIFYILLPSS